LPEMIALENPIWEFNFLVRDELRKVKK